MKKIVIDCRYLEMSGIGRFLEGILDEFDFSQYDCYLLGKEKYISKYPMCKQLIEESSPFSKKGILNIGWLKEINCCDSFISPNFIIPYGIKIECITVLHDIIFLDMPNVNKNWLEYKIKKILLKRCMKKSKHVFTVSNFSKNRIGYYYPKYKTKITYSYQGVAKLFKEYVSDGIKEDYVVYVGNIKKHKGLKTLLRATEELKNLKIYIIGDKDGFINGDDEVLKYINHSNITFTGKLSDDKLVKIVSHAKFLIQPSFYEGFGLPPLEALYLGTKPIITDIEVFKEVYKDLPVIFFKKDDTNDLIDKINNSEFYLNCDKKRLDAKFSYEKFARNIQDSI